ncbi:putative disease resistance RPP13 protein 1 [Spatholobus suberectus]|nr:putative disease resistance RPP13 protein 1 [Spatholobus suberectus]
MGRLTNLRCLDTRGIKLSEIPLHIGTLTNLQSLTGYVLGSGGGSGIEELKNFPFLKGKISISNLQNIIDPQDAMKDSLLSNMQLDGLMLSWSTNADDLKNVRNILHWLEPPKTLKKLTIRNYGSTSFPAWLGDFQFSKLVSICLYDCVNCVVLPTLGQLPSLKAPSLVGFSSVVCVDGKFYNDSSMEEKQFQRQDITAFKCLETLLFENMPQSQEWLPFGEEEKEDEKRAFPCLQQLYIKNCPKLEGENLIQKLPAMEKIVIVKCEQLVVAFPPTIRELQLECYEKVSIQRPLPQLLNLTISSYNAVESLFELPSNGIANTLKSLNVTNCENIEFPMNQCFAYLESLCFSSSCNSMMDMFPKMVCLEIRRCPNLESLEVSGEHVQYLQSLNSLKISDCPNFVSFPEGGLAAPNLTNLQLEKCKNLNSLPCEMNKLLPSLMTLNIKECPELKSFSEGGLPDSLNLLEIFHCAKLFTNRKNWNLQKLPSLRSFAIAGSCQERESFPERWLLPSTLTSFHVLALWNLKYLDEGSLQQLTSLETLGIACCPKLQCMPAKLPSSVSTLHIMRSPRLEERCEGKKS